MDLSKYDTSEAANRGRFMHLEFQGTPLLEGGERVGLYVKGMSSAEFKAGEKRLRERQLERVRVNRSGKVKGIQHSDEDTRELYASLVVGYVHLSVDGKPLPEKAEMRTTLALFERFRWVYDQVVAFVDDEANFLGEP